MHVASPARKKTILSPSVTNEPLTVRVRWYVAKMAVGLMPTFGGNGGGEGGSDGGLGGDGGGGEGRGSRGL